MRFLTLGALAGPLPNTLVDGMVADAAPVMANFQSLVDNVNGNIGNYSYQIPITGFAISMADDEPGLLLEPAGTLATGTVTLAAAPADGLQAWILSTQIVTLLGVGSGTGTIVGAPTALAANVAVRFVYRLANNTWYRMV